MSLSSILRSGTENEDWSKIYVSELNSKTLNVTDITVDHLDVNSISAQSATIEDLNIGISPNQYEFPTAIGSRSQILRASGTPNSLIFGDNIIGSLPFAGNIASANNYFKYCSPVNSSPTANPADFDAGVYIPFSSKILAISFATESGIGNGQWVIRVNTTNNNITPPNIQSGIFAPSSPIQLTLNDRVAVGITGGTTFPDQANITLWLVQT